MSFRVRNKLLLSAFLAVLSLRALTPDGYMPGSNGSGLIYELCPSGMPAEIMRALAGGGHHHHGHHDDDPGSVSGTEQCPIGHMLGSAVAADTSVPTGFLPVAPEFDDATVIAVLQVRRAAYRSRAPPA
jgi:hypothetical protein